MDRLTESNIAIMFGVLLASGFLLVFYNFLLHSCLIMFNDVWLEACKRIVHIKNTRAERKLDLPLPPS